MVQCLYAPNGAQWLTVSEGNAPCLVRNNYTSISKTRGQFARASGRPYRIAEPYNEESLNDNNFGLVFRNNTVVEDLNWNKEAKQLMAKAGLSGEYASLRNNYPERLFTDLPAKGEKLVMAENSTFNINLRATDGKDSMIDLSQATIAYMSADESIVTVSDTGVITSVGKGDTKVRVYVMMNGLVQIIEQDVSVGTNIKDIYISLMDSKGTLTIATNSDPVSLVPYAVTERDVQLVPDAVQLKVANSIIAKLNENNEIVPQAIGETTLDVTVTAMGKTFSKTFIIKVIEPVEFELDDLEEIFLRSSISGWKNNKAKITIVQDKQLDFVALGTGYNTFTPHTYLNELFCFEFALHAESLWPSFALRAQDGWSYVSSGTTGYLISFTRTGIQLQRFNGSDRTVLYGNVEGFDPVYGGDIQFYLENDKLYKVQLGALTNGTNVHLFLSVNGEIVFNCVDKAYGAITAPGHFGIICKEGDTFHIEKAQDLSEYTVPDVSTGAGAGTGGNNPGSDNPGGDNPGQGTGGTIPTTLPTIPVFSKRPLPTIKGQNTEGDGTNGWILPVAIAATCVVVAGVAVGGVVLRKKKKVSVETDASEQ